MLAALLAPLLLGVTGAPDTVLLDFRADWCGPCRAMEPVMQQLGAAGYPVRMVNIDQDRALAQKFHVSSIPCFVLIVDGQEVQRTVGMNDISTLVAMFRRAGYDPSGRPSPTAAAQNGGATGTAAGEMAPIDGREPTFAQGATAAAAASQSPAVGGSRGGTDRNTDAAGAAGGFALSEAQLLAACARLKVADRTGNSYGSGTIVDVRNGEALVLTCAHLFRDSDGKGDIRVDLYGPGQPQQVAGRLIGCDLEKDVGLVSIPATSALQAIHVAPPGYTLHKGDRVATIGCSNAAPPTVQSSHIDSIDRFRGPPNFQVAGQPVQGRSGGGVVSADGYVIGVCNAADPDDNEGLYAALASIYKELDRAKLSFVYRATPPSTAPESALAAAQFTAQSASSPPLPSAEAKAPGSEPAVSLADAEHDLPAMPAKMPANASLGAANASLGSAAAATAAAVIRRGSAGLTSDEAATLAEIRQKAKGAEVICIVRPLSDPHARSEIIVLDKASPEFLQKLADERRSQVEALRQLTSLQVPAGNR
ncbi:MAG TPA: trypsin-like peptidase domain-containing protein [Pirellulales bacterium]|nr:trypsin-like peptidase domain-containing protein [Pirellulales bacterium]